jgi:hypothetical protein
MAKPTHLPAFALLLVTLAAGAAIARPVFASSPPSCPIGQVPKWDNSGCMAVQTQPSLAGIGIPSLQKAVPQGGLNGAPAMKDCNGIPVPILNSCQGVTPSLITQAISAPTPASSPPLAGVPAAQQQPSIVVASAGAGAALSAVAPNLPASATADPVAALRNLLGDWYSGWMSYLQSAMGFSDAMIQQTSASFAILPPCISGQATACESAIWQQMSQWVGPAAGGT